MSEQSSSRSGRFLGAVLAGRYRAEKLLSQSESDAVFRAEDVVEGKRVAVRVVYAESMTPELQAILDREAAVAARVSSPAVAACKPAGIAEDGSTLLLLPDLDGPTIREVSEEAEASTAGRVALSRAAVIAKQIALGLEAIHGAGVVHRALSPDCVRVLPAIGGGREEVRITDFSAAQIDKGSAGPRLDGGSTAASYAAPEVLRGGEVDERADFYALGLIFYEMVTGSKPELERTGSLPTMTSIRSVPAAVDALALRLLADDPSRRAAIAMDVVQALDALAEPAPAPPPKSAGPSSSSSSSGSNPTTSSPSGSVRRADAPRSSLEATPAPAVNGRAVTSLVTNRSGGTRLISGLGDVPREARWYFMGTGAIVLLLLLAVAVRPPVVAGDDQPAETKPESSAPSKEAPRGAAPSASSEAPLTAADLRSRMEKSLKTGNVGAFLADLERLLDEDPSVADDKDLKGTLIDLSNRIMIGGGADADRLFNIIGTKLGTVGPDLLFELVTTKGGSLAAKRAEDMLKDAALRSRGTEALRIAYDLRFTRGCEEKAALLERAKDEGDRRAMTELQLAVQDCHRGECCLSNDPGYKPAMDAIKDRISK